MASDRGKQQAYCKVCSKHFSVSHGGIDDVRRHGEGKKHFELFNTRKSTNQVTKYYISSNSSSLDENVIKAETLISLAMAKHNVPLAFADHLAKVVKVAIPDSSIAKKYACGRGKNHSNNQTGHRSITTGPSCGNVPKQQIFTDDR